MRSLSAGGFADPSSESARATALLAEKFGQDGLDMALLLTADGGVRNGPAKLVGTDIVRQLAASPCVARVASPWDSPRPAPGLISADGRSALIIAELKGGEKEAPRHAQALADRLTRERDGVRVRAGGTAIVYADVNRQTETDLVRMEVIAIPLSFVALVWVFGGLLAAAVPLAVSGFAILGSLAALRALALVTDVSVFALNVAAALGLALAIDYTLLIISRYREELDGAGSREQALLRTMASAGRTVLFSATTVALSLAAMVLFPMPFMKSFAYAGVAVVALSALAAVAVAPAVLVLLGDRLAADRRSDSRRRGGNGSRRRGNRLGNRHGCRLDSRSRGRSFGQRGFGHVRLGRFDLQRRRRRRHRRRLDPHRTRLVGPVEQHRQEHRRQRQQYQRPDHPLFQSAIQQGHAPSPSIDCARHVPQRCIQLRDCSQASASATL